MRVWQVGVGLLTIQALAACGPSAARLRCLDQCAAHKDTCMLNANEAAGVQRCDAEGKSCNVQCPR